MSQDIMYFQPEDDPQDTGSGTGGSQAGREGETERRTLVPDSQDGDNVGEAVGERDGRLVLEEVQVSEEEEDDFVVEDSFAVLGAVKTPSQRIKSSATMNESGKKKGNRSRVQGNKTVKKVTRQNKSSKSKQTPRRGVASVTADIEGAQCEFPDAAILDVQPSPDKRHNESQSKTKTSKATKSRGKKATKAVRQKKKVPPKQPARDRSRGRTATKPAGVAMFPTAPPVYDLSEEDDEEEHDSADLDSLPPIEEIDDNDLTAKIGNRFPTSTPRRSTVFNPPQFSASMTRIQTVMIPTPPTVTRRRKRKPSATPSLPEGSTCQVNFFLMLNF